MGDAAAGAAPDEAQPLAAPRVGARRTGRADHPHLRCRVVGPQRAVAAADRAIAVGQAARPARSLDPHGAAVAGRGKHDGYSLADAVDESVWPNAYWHNVPVHDLRDACLCNPHGLGLRGHAMLNTAWNGARSVGCLKNASPCGIPSCLMVFFLGRFGQTLSGCSTVADFNRDGSVNTAHLTIFLGNFGQTRTNTLLFGPPEGGSQGAVAKWAAIEEGAVTATNAAASNAPSVTAATPPGPVTAELGFTSAEAYETYVSSLSESQF